MRKLLLFIGLCLSLTLILPAHAGPRDTKPPRVFITDVVKKKVRGGMTFFNFSIKATDNIGIKRIEYRVAVDGKESGWTKYPYFTGFDNELPFTVDCNIFRFEVRSVDKAGNKSKVARKSYSGLQ